MSFAAFPGTRFFSRLASRLTGRKTAPARPPLPPALACLRFLAARFRGEDAAATAFSTEFPAGSSAEPISALDAIARRLDFEPEALENALIPDDYSGPVIAELQDQSWICALQSEYFALPMVAFWSPKEEGMRHMPAMEFQKALTGRMRIFRGLSRPAAAGHTGLACLALVGRYHGIDLDERRLSHDYAQPAGEPSLRSLADMAEDNGLKRKMRNLTWDEALALEGVYPVLGRKQSGAYFLLAGVARSDDGDMRLAVIDPDPDPEDHSLVQGMHRFWSSADFAAFASGEAMLLKKRYGIAEEGQPFGLRWFIPEFLKLKGLFAQITMAVFMMTLLSLLMPLFFQIVIDKVLPNSGFTTLNILAIGITLSILFNGCLEFLRNYLLLFATNKIDINTAMKTFSHLMRLPIDFFDAVPSGLLIKHMQQTEKIRGFLSGNLFFALLDMVSLAVFIPFLLLYSVPLTAIVLGFSFLLALIIAALIKPFQRRLHILYQAEGRRQSRLVESLHGIHTVKALALEPVEAQEWNNASAFSINAHFAVGKISLSAHAISQILELLMQVAVIWTGAHMVFNQVISIGALIAFQMLSGRVSGPLVKLAGLIHEYQQTALSVKMLGAVMNSPPEPAGGGVRQPVQGRITLEDVRFRYTPHMPDAVQDISLDIRAGESLGIVGRSGSGKSTLMRLMQAMYQPQRGVIKIDGIDIREMDKAHLRRSIGVVLQENYFFQGSIRDNIRLTRKDAASEAVIKAAVLAGAHEFVSALPKGYDTILEENASNLSGGQKQRLAIARVLLTEPAILILDEATSALDPESEHIILRNLKDIARGRTVLIVSHRLSMVRWANRILVLDKGAITALAPHDVLVHKDGVYKEFWQQQMGIRQTATGI